MFSIKLNKAVLEKLIIHSTGMLNIALKLYGD
jgi:hypothetical protein